MFCSRKQLFLNNNGVNVPVHNCPNYVVKQTNSRV